MNYRGFRIKEIHAIIGIDRNDEEGILAFPTAEGPFPLIASDRVRLEELTKAAQRIADDAGKNFEIVRFSVREKVGEIVSKKQRKQ